MLSKAKSTCKELDIKTLQLEKIAQYQSRGAILGSKAPWYNEGEKNTKYFLCRNGTSIKKTIKQLQSDKKGVINTDDKILQEAKSFYQNLYSTLSDQANLSYEDIFFPKISQKDLMNSRRTNVKVF